MNRIADLSVSSHDGLHDPQVVAAIEEYCAALEAGRCPNRAELLARFPEVAAQLRDCLISLEVVYQWTEPNGGSKSHERRFGTVDATPWQIGDYRMIRQLGRGGMGVVYEAEQVSLGRHVAVKVLPFSAVLDERQRARFELEARAAAILDHPGIVGIHAVGCDLGVHYYAMQLVEGHTLADLVEELRHLGGLPPLRPGSAMTVSRLTRDLATGRLPQPAPAGPAGPDPLRQDGIQAAEDTIRCVRNNTVSPAADTAGLPSEPGFFRSVAKLGVQAAEALHHAHSMGVVHRDIKPSNLMVDVQGHLYVADFGLALIRSDARLTMTGDLLGTARYMSPEQIGGRRDALDHRTDVYSLGASLYEISTLQPVVGGQDRRHLLDRILHDDPTPPRRINPAMPRELEIILLKSLAKRPRDRYASAAALAEDLRRFLDGRPILARPPSLVARAANCLRRRRTLAASMALALGGLVLVVASSLALLWRTETTTEQRSQAEAAVLDAVDSSLRAQQVWQTAERESAVTAQRELAHSLRQVEPWMDHRPVYWQGTLDAHLLLAQWLNSTDERHEATVVLDHTVRALAAFERHAGPASAHRLALATRLAEHGRREMADGQHLRAADSIRAALDLFQSTDVLDPSLLLEIAQCHYDLAECRRRAGDHSGADESQQRYVQALGRYRQALPAGEPPQLAVERPLGPIAFVDLSPRANWPRWRKQAKNNDLRELPEGEQWFLGVKLRIAEAGLLLGSTYGPQQSGSLDNVPVGQGTNRPGHVRDMQRPASFDNIPVGQRFEQLFILHATSWGLGSSEFPLPDGTQIAEYRLRYEDGSQETIPVVKGVDVREWHTRSDPRPASNSHVAFRANNPYLYRSSDRTVRLFLSIWQNPHSHKRITQLDYVSSSHPVARPFCVAISGELTEPVNPVHKENTP